MSAETELNSTDEGSPRWQRRPDERPTEILEAALLVFGERGYAGTRLEDVARQAGVSKGTVYLYFDSKEALFQEMVRNKVGAAITQFRETVRQHTGTSEALLRQIIAMLWRGMRDESKVRLSRLVHSEITNFPELARFYFGEVVIPAREIVSQVISRGIRSGEFAPVNPDLVGRTICVALVQWASNQRFLKEFDSVTFSDAEVFDGVSELMLRGLKAGAPGAPKE
ncbi:MAG TPA: TetR/AcrR family transcriptional regulator [Gemmatimonadales bacterium]|nr:TetR/AcrR family transcriptional regulator [Gemmatimonadales bacterium]